MTRSIEMLFVSLSAVPEAQAQQQPMRVDLDQALLDRWLIAMPQIIKLGKSSSAPQSDETARPHMERICAGAGFDSYDQCQRSPYRACPHGVRSRCVARGRLCQLRARKRHIHRNNHIHIEPLATYFVATILVPPSLRC